MQSSEASGAGAKGFGTGNGTHHWRLRHAGSAASKGFRQRYLTPVTLAVAATAFTSALLFVAYDATTTLGIIKRELTVMGTVMAARIADEAPETINAALAGAMTDFPGIVRASFVEPDAANHDRPFSQLVPVGDHADAFLVPAQLNGQIALFLVERGASGLALRGYGTQDGGRAAELQCTDTPATLLTQHGLTALTLACDVANAALCAEAVGAMEAANAQTLEYLKTRKQFGVPIGTFQVLQHRMADMFIHAEQAKSITVLAAVKVGSAPAEERRKLVSAAKVRVGKALQFVGQQAIQMHGGMGMTNEMPISHYFKRLTAIEMTLGNTDFHRSRFIRQPDFMAV